MATLEKELGLALGEQPVESCSVGTPTSSSPLSAEAPQHEIESRERSETTGGILQELRETQVVEGAAVAAPQQEELVAQKQELGQPATGG